MNKLISCWNVTEKCYFVVRDESEEEVLKKFAEHVESAHRMKLTEDLREKAKAMIRKAA